jgi:hypothetical protein
MKSGVPVASPAATMTPSARLLLVPAIAKRKLAAILTLNVEPPPTPASIVQSVHLGLVWTGPALFRETRQVHRAVNARAVVTVVGARFARVEATRPPVFIPRRVWEMSASTIARHSIHHWLGGCVAQICLRPVGKRDSVHRSEVIAPRAVEIVSSWVQRHAWVCVGPSGWPVALSVDKQGLEGGCSDGKLRVKHAIGKSIPPNAVDLDSAADHSVGFTQCRCKRHLVTRTSTTVGGGKSDGPVDHVLATVHDDSCRWVQQMVAAPDAIHCVLQCRWGLCSAVPTDQSVW